MNSDHLKTRLRTAGVKHYNEASAFNISSKSTDANLRAELEQTQTLGEQVARADLDRKYRHQFSTTNFSSNVASRAAPSAARERDLKAHPGLNASHQRPAEIRRFGSRPGLAIDKPLAEHGQVAVRLGQSASSNVSSTYRALPRAPLPRFSNVKVAKASPASNSTRLFSKPLGALPKLAVGAPKVAVGVPKVAVSVPKVAVGVRNSGFGVPTRSGVKLSNSFMSVSNSSKVPQHKSGQVGNPTTVVSPPILPSQDSFYKSSLKTTRTEAKLPPKNASKIQPRVQPQNRTKLISSTTAA